MYFPRIKQYRPAVAEFVIANGVNKNVIKGIGTGKGKKYKKKICRYAYEIIARA
jgi:hypothetical protein